MPEDSFLLISLKDAESKKLAQVISNDTSRKILAYLSKKPSVTETELAREINVPLSTVHYNLQHLAKAKLVDTDEFHYSEKGKEVIHYSLSNKYIIIAPKASPKFLDSLKKIIPAVLIVGATTGIMKLFEVLSRPMVAKSAPRAFATEEAAVDMIMAQDAANIAQPVITNNLIIYFLAGALFAIAVYLMMDVFSKRMK